MIYFALKYPDMKNIYLLILVSIFIFSCNSAVQKEENENSNVNISINGGALGTTFSIKYIAKDTLNLQKEIDSLLNDFENSLSTYRKTSVISKINNNDTSVVLDHYFLDCYNRSVEISEITDGAFDMTVAPLVNAWGFGFTEKTEVDADIIDSLKQFVGFDKVSLIENNIIKEDPRIMLDASAIAKGQAVDVVSKYLATNGINNHMVEIGGEIVARGVNFKGEAWKIAIDKPLDDPFGVKHEFQEVVELKDKAMATSGSNRQFYIKDGVRYSHTIDPETGSPVAHTLLSVSVLANNCMTSDAYATAFMVLGVEKSMEILSTLENIDAYFIYSDEDGKMKSIYTKGIESIIVK